MFGYFLTAAISATITMIVMACFQIGKCERIAELEDILEKINASGLTPEDIAFFQNPKMVEICKRICAAADSGKL